jgi:hypothetical protein
MGVGCYFAGAGFPGYVGNRESQISRQEGGARRFSSVSSVMRGWGATLQALDFAGYVGNRELQISRQVGGARSEVGPRQNFRTRTSSR